MLSKKIIGLTYDLKKDYLAEGYSEEEAAEFDSEETIEGIERAIHLYGYETERIGHFKNLVKQVSNGKTWDLVTERRDTMFAVITGTGNGGNWR